MKIWRAIINLKKFGCAARLKKELRVTDPCDLKVPAHKYQVLNYDNNFGVEKIVWVVAGQKLMRRIHALSVAHATLKKLDHLFIAAEDAKKLLWQAKFKNDSMKGVTLAEFLNSFLKYSKTPPTSHLTSTPTSPSQVGGDPLASSVLMNFDGCFVKSSPYSKTNRGRKT